MEDFILIVDDELAVRQLLHSQLSFLGYSARATENPESAIKLAASDTPPALVLLDIELPRFSGLDVLRQIKEIDEDVQVVMISGLHDFEVVRQCLRSGAYDYLAKPFELEDLHATVDRALERRSLIRDNRETQENLQRMVEEQTEEIRQTRDMALMTLARLAESRDRVTGLHLERISEYSRILASSLSETTYRDQVDEQFIEWLVIASPLHDIGKVGIPDAILLKQGPLTDEEWRIMRTHTTIGGDTLKSVLKSFSARTELNMAMEIAYNHHERWDGGGYPHRLEADEIPLSARIVTVSDAYDAITSTRPYKEALSHEEAVRRIEVDKGRHFDPVLVESFKRCQNEFAAVQQRLQDYATA